MSETNSVPKTKANWRRFTNREALRALPVLFFSMLILRVGMSWAFDRDYGLFENLAFSSFWAVIFVLTFRTLPLLADYNK